METIPDLQDLLNPGETVKFTGQPGIKSGSRKLLTLLWGILAGIAAILIGFKIGGMTAATMGVGFAGAGIAICFLFASGEIETILTDERVIQRRQSGKRTRELALVEVKHVGRLGFHGIAAFWFQMIDDRIVQFKDVVEPEEFWTALPAELRTDTSEDLNYRFQNFCGASLLACFVGTAFVTVLTLCGIFVVSHFLPIATLNDWIILGLAPVLIVMIFLVRFCIGLCATFWFFRKNISPEDARLFASFLLDPASDRPMDRIGKVFLPILAKALSKIYDRPNGLC